MVTRRPCRKHTLLWRNRTHPGNYQPEEFVSINVRRARRRKTIGRAPVVLHRDAFHDGIHEFGISLLQFLDGQHEKKSVYVCLGGSACAGGCSRSQPEFGRWTKKERRTGMVERLCALQP